METHQELTDLIGRHARGHALADELLRRWLHDPDATPKWQRLADDVRLDEEVD